MGSGALASGCFRWGEGVEEKMEESLSRTRCRQCEDDPGSLQVRKQHLDLLSAFAGDPHRTAGSANPYVKKQLASSEVYRAKIAQVEFVDPATGRAALL